MITDELRNYFMPDSSRDSFIEWCINRMHSFYSVPAWMDYLHEFDFVVGPRFHGVMLAIQSGIPAGCIAHDSRTLELCNTTGIPVKRFDEVKEEITQDRLKMYFSFDGELYNKNRFMLLREYINLLCGSGIPIKQDLFGLLEFINPSGDSVHENRNL